MKSGLTRNGKQRCYCGKCGCTNREDAQISTYDIVKREQVIRLYLIFKSFRKVAQMYRVDRRTMANWIKHNGVTVAPTKKPEAEKLKAQSKRAR